MVNEAILRDKLAEPIDVTVADGTGIAKGELLKLTDPRTAEKSDGIGDTIAGIAAREKVASDGRTRLAVFTKGIFDMVASGVITVGSPVVSGIDSEDNTVATGQTAVPPHSGASVIGYALETSTNHETVQVMLNIGA